MFDKKSNFKKKYGQSQIKTPTITEMYKKKIIL